VTNIRIIGAGYVGPVTAAGFGELPCYRRGKEPQSGARLGFTCEGAVPGIWSHMDGFPGNCGQRQDPLATPERRNSYRVLTLHIHLSYQTEDRMIPVTNGGNTAWKRHIVVPASGPHLLRRENGRG
jgi:hypothetical protein